jgi:hypothetical protein
LPYYPPPQIEQQVIVRNNHGGLVDQYLAQSREWEYQGKRIRIGGFCNSACTLYLHNNNACVEGPSTRIGFHAARSLWGEAGHPIIGPIDENSTQVMMNYYPENVRAWILRHGGLGYRMIFLTGKELLSIVPRCVNAVHQRYRTR